MSKAQTAANKRYNLKAYDRIEITVPKGNREIIAQAGRNERERLYQGSDRSTDRKAERVNAKALSERTGPFILYRTEETP